MYIESTSTRLPHSPWCWENHECVCTCVALCLSLKDTSVLLSAEKTRNSVCWPTWEYSPNPREPFISPHRTGLLPSWWGELVSARSLSSRDDASQVKPPASLSQASLALSLEKTMPAHLWGTKPNSRHTPSKAQCQFWDQQIPPSWHVSAAN